MARVREDCCMEIGCALKHYARGWCRLHWERAKRRGDFTPNPDWKSLPRPLVAYRGPGGHITANGYRKIRVIVDGHARWVLEHRHVMETLLGRPLFPEENIHHKNGDRLDNAPDNLELWITRQPRGARVGDLLEWAREIVQRYGEI